MVATFNPRADCYIVVFYPLLPGKYRMGRPRLGVAVLFLKKTLISLIIAKKSAQFA